jgi:hypothetical protein
MKKYGLLILLIFLISRDHVISQSLDLLRKQCTFEDLKSKIVSKSDWGSSAHLYASEAGAGLPDVEKPYAGLITAMTSSLMTY